MSLFSPSGGNINLSLSGTLEEAEGTFYIQEGASVETATGTIIFQSGSVYNEGGGGGEVPESASQIFYDNLVSGLSAENVQEAIDELKGDLGAISVPESASQLFYDNSELGLFAENVQEAIDEVGAARSILSYEFYPPYNTPPTPPYDSDFTASFATESMGAVYLIDTFGNDVVVTLPEISETTIGKILIFKKLSGSNSLYINSPAVSPPPGGIDGANSASVLTADMSSLTLINNGQDWYII